ncbi:MAG: acyltransferase family protein [Povalibacter sp.]
MNNNSNTALRWDALDVLRGLSIIGMLLNLNPGSWEHNYSWLVHARWEGWTLIDMVAPAFLFCVGAALPLSLQRRFAKGASRKQLLAHVATRSLILVALGVFLNLYPDFDFDHFRVPGVLQRIGLCYGIVGAIVIATARVRVSGSLVIRPVLLASIAVFILVSYWILLYAVPVLGSAAPRFDPVGSWPAVIDRAVIGTNHMFKFWPVNGQVTFDPEGIVSTYPACFNVVLGVLVGWAYSSRKIQQPAAVAVITGIGLIVLAILARGVCPIIKNLWTSSFALLSGGISLTLLGVLMPISRQPVADSVLQPARIFGENPLLAYVVSWLIGPLLDLPWIGSSEIPISLRNAGQLWFGQVLSPNAASFLFGLCCLLLIFMLLVICHRKRWILKI